MTKLYALVLAALLTAVCVVQLAADDYALAWSANTCGGERMVGGNGVATVSLGQLTIGTSVAGQRMAQLGVWSAEGAPPLLVPSPGTAKLQGDGMRLALAGLMVTAEPSRFPDRIYAEASDRSSGIALVGIQGETALLPEGTLVNVVGGISTLDGERIMLNPMLAAVGQEVPLAAVGTINRDVGGVDLGIPPLGQRGVLNGWGPNNVGLFIKTWGVVIDDGYTDYILINDGSRWPLWGENGLRVAKANLSPVPEVGDYIQVSGISRVRVRGSLLDAVIYARRPGDLVILPLPASLLMETMVRREGK